MEALRVLVVDDDPRIRELVSICLRTAGFRVETATSGQDALDKLKSSSPEVLLSDLDMPGMNGIALIHRARKTHPNLVPLILSASVARKDTIAAIKEGVFDFIDKSAANFAALEIPVRRAGEHARMLHEREQLLRELERKNAQLEDSLSELKATYKDLNERDQRLHEDLQRAQQMQQRMLPAALPPFGPYEFGAYYRPCEMLGGDFFDCIPIDDHRMALYLADVSGHGVAAAMATVVLREVMHARHNDDAGRGFFADPEHVLTFLNRALREELSNAPVHVTMSYLVLNLTEHRIHYGAAGHPLPLVTRGGEYVSVPPVAGPGLGLAVDATFAAGSVAFPVGASLLVYSDGLTEAPAPDATLVTPEAVRTWLDDSAHTSARDLVRAIERRFLAHLNGESPPDDVSFVVIHHGAADIAHRRATVVFANPSDAPEREQAPPTAHLTVGKSADHVLVRVAGRATWKLGRLLERAVEEANSDEPGRVILDLSECESLDSTLLGLLCRMASRVSIWGLAGVAESQTRELGIHSALRLAKEVPPPVTFSDIDAASEADDESGRMILAAHETLSGLSEKNQERFAGVIEMLREEWGEKTG